MKRYAASQPFARLPSLEATIPDQASGRVTTRMYGHPVRHQNPLTQTGVVVVICQQNDSPRPLSRPRLKRILLFSTSPFISLPTQIPPSSFNPGTRSESQKAKNARSIASSNITSDIRWHERGKTLAGKVPVRVHDLGPFFSQPGLKRLPWRVYVDRWESDLNELERLQRRVRESRIENRAGVI